MKQTIVIILSAIIIIGCSKQVGEPVKDTNKPTTESKRTDISPEIIKNVENKLKGENTSFRLIPEESLSGMGNILTVQARFLKRKEVVPDASLISYWMVMADGKYFKINKIEDLKTYLNPVDTGEKAAKTAKIIASLILSKKKLNPLSPFKEDNIDNFEMLNNAFYKVLKGDKGEYEVLAYKDEKDINNSIAEINFDKDGKLIHAGLK